MIDPNAPYHAHIYFDDAERDAAAALRDGFSRDPAILLVGDMADGAAGPHPSGLTGWVRGRSVR